MRLLKLSFCNNRSQINENNGCSFDTLNKDISVYIFSLVAGWQFNSARGLRGRKMRVHRKHQRLYVSLMSCVLSWMWRLLILHYCGAEMCSTLYCHCHLRNHGCGDFYNTPLLWYKDATCVLLRIPFLR